MARRCSMGVAVSAAAAMLTAVTAPAAAQVRGGSEAPDGTSAYDVYADVVSVAPRYVWRDVTEPVRQCISQAPAYPADSWSARRRETFRHDERPDAAAGVLGGLLGGLFGHQFGHGDGRVALTVAGALLGSSIARQQARQDRVYRYGSDAYLGRDMPVQEVHRCTERTRTRRIRETDGYDVTYRYHGATFHKWLDAPPGDTVRVRVVVEPAGG